MTRIDYHKLVRDRIPEIIAAEGRTYEIETLDETAYREALLTKLVEEAEEVRLAGENERVKELADLYEVIDAIITAFTLDKADILAIQAKRRTERGGFLKRIKLVWTE